ncbi:SH3 domain-containing protein [Bacillus weihaiensis]|uniref:SH3b domain-containing protein n=1 Tax=Bacillus weihaiensis TaxID=1547283 RepID=A0A1L3MMF4_9BACI|nr:SH3 domain-containing protein [Bacillus weihaiensis]APH03538.1 hypothetical protein A9C19_01535 [Bacillus weihaiensis]
METIFNQVFWLWVPLAFLPIWLRIAIVTYIGIILARPIVVRLTPLLIHWGSIFFKKAVEYLSYPLMVLFHKQLEKRRSNHDYSIPTWIETSEDVCAALIKGFEKLEVRTQKRTRNKARFKKVFRLAALVLAVLLPLAILNNPTTSYSQSWQNFETWITQEKVEKQLGYDLTKLQATITYKVDEASSKLTKKKLTLSETYKAEGGNIRSEPSLNGKIISSIKQDESVTYLNEQQTDDRGITWLKVETNQGKVGWISDKIVE